MAIVNIGIEICGVLIDQMAARQGQKTALALADAPADPAPKAAVEPASNPKSPLSPTKSGLSDDDLDQLDKLGGELSDGLKDQTKAPEKAS
jgi:hypothetical protein